MKRVCPHATCDPDCCLHPEGGRGYLCHSDEDSKIESEDDTTSSAEASQTVQTVEELFPLAEAVHEITSEVNTAFCMYHYTQPDAPTPWYIVMMYDSKSSSFTYWCDRTPSWDILQTTARKFVTENHCSALYACAEVTTETESSDNDGDAADGDTPNESTASVDGPGNSAVEVSVEVASEEPKSLTTRIENVYVKMGRVSNFRTPEKAIPKNSEVNYKNFAVMRKRDCTDGLSTAL